MNREEAMMRLIADINAAEIVSHIEDGTLHQWIESWRETTQIALSALRPVSRKQVEKVWKGEWIEELYNTTSERNRIIHCKKCICSVCNKSNGRKKENFCPHCGAPMKDEAVDMVMERLESLYEQKV